MKEIFDRLGMVSAIILPFFNLPLIIRIIRRKSSDDISLVWVLGVWVGMLLMAPAALTSDDHVWKTFTYFNVSFFTVVMITVLKYRHGKDKI